MQGWIIVAVAAAYLALLLGVAAYGEARRPAWLAGRMRPHLYALGLGVYCTAWSFAGAIGLAATSGWTFVALTLGAVTAIGAFRPLVARVVRLAKANNITSIADLIGARYGKSQRVAGLVAIAAVIGATPYLALQLKAITLALGTALGRDLPVDPALAAALALAAFACLFGTRQVEATERHEGLMLAIATESVVKLAAFLAVGGFVVWSLFDGPADLYARAAAAGVLAPFEHAPPADSFAALALLSFLGAFLLPRQFHVTVVEARDADETATAAWLFPLYAVAMSLFVAPIAAAGLATFASAGRVVDPDAYILALPLAAGAPWIAVIALTGVLSAATAMVLVESVALAIMVSNDLVIPALLKGPEAARPDMSRRLLGFRRLAIVVILLGAYAAHRMAGAAQLASLGLLSLAAIAQLAPAFFGGLAWRRATARGAIAGLSIGLVTWAWTLALPALASHWPGSTAFLDSGPYGVSWLAPRSLFGAGMADPLAHGVFWSLLLNALAFVLVSLLRPPSQIESQQAEAFADGGAPPAPVQVAGSFRPWRSRVTTGDLVQAVGRYLGADRADRAFAGFARGRGAPLEPKAEADVQTLRFAEHLLASAIGAASSRLVLSLLLSRRNVTTQDALRLLDDASAAMQSNRDVLQTALDNARQGITAIDGRMKLVAWNREFRELFDLPEQMIHAGVGLDDIFRFNAARGLYGPVHEEEFVADRIQRFVVRLETLRTRLQPSGRVIEIRSARMPDGGVVTTYTDITETVNAQQALELANENLERRVRERTRELTRLNQELARAKTVADEANISKTRFLAAASHDILQPLNAARLFATSLVERTTPEEDFGRLSRNVDASLDAVEEILSALLDISRLDTGAMKPELSVFRLDEITAQLGREFAPVAAEKGLKLAVVGTSLAVRSDRRLLRRLLQNLVSNAIKYTPAGRVIVGVRRLPDSRIRVEVWDTGLGIASGQQQLVFREFKRLEQGAKVAPGLGLGLSIVERIARVLDHPLTLRSKPGMGSVFAIELPTSVALPAPKPVEGLAGQRGASLAGLVVIAIDNEPAILDGMATLLSGWGCTALTAANQREAEALMRARKLTPDALLADYHLDEADGLEAIVNLRWKLGQPIPAILITADRSPGLRELAAEKDVQVLPKPIRPAALRALLAQLLARRAAAE